MRFSGIAPRILSIKSPWGSRTARPSPFRRSCRIKLKRRVDMPVPDAPMMYACCALCSEDSRTSVTFGGPVGRFTHLQQQLAQHTSQLFMAKLLVENTAGRIDKKVPAVADSAMCKA